MTRAGSGTALHRAAWAGDLAVVEQLVADGADLSDRENPFVSTPYSWASHNGQEAVCRWMRVHCALDLHDAVSFDLRDHVQARLREHPESVNRCIDHWHMPHSGALHWAAALHREEIAAMLLAAGADPNLRAGNGLTPLDVVDYTQGTAVAVLIAQYGGKRAADL